MKIFEVACAAFVGVLAWILETMIGFTVAHAVLAGPETLDPVPSPVPSTTQAVRPNPVVPSIDTKSVPAPSPSSVKPTPKPKKTTKAPPPPREEPDTYYANCAEAHDANAAPLYRGDPGYRSGLDRDSDGVACE